MIFRIMTLLCCLSFSLMTLAQASGGEIRRPHTTKSNTLSPKVEKRASDKRRNTNSTMSSSNVISQQNKQVKSAETRECTKCGRTLSLSHFTTDVSICENCFHLLLDQKRKKR